MSPTLPHGIAFPTEVELVRGVERGGIREIVEPLVRVDEDERWGKANGSSGKARRELKNCCIVIDILIPQALTIALRLRANVEHACTSRHHLLDSRPEASHCGAHGLSNCEVVFPANKEDPGGDECSEHRIGFISHVLAGVAAHANVVRHQECGVRVVPVVDVGIADEQKLSLSEGHKVHSA